jgi:hypothetical protein
MHPPADKFSWRGMTHRKEKSAYREKKKLLTVQRKKCLPRRENFAYQAEKKLLTAGCKISLPRTDFFQPVHLHGELADLLCVSCFLFAFFGEFFFQVFLPGVVKDHRGFLKEFLFPVPEEVRLNAIFGSNDVQFLFPSYSGFVRLIVTLYSSLKEGGCPPLRESSCVLIIDQSA